MIGLTPDITSVAVVRHGALRLTFTDDLTGELETRTIVWPGGGRFLP
jgi:hypothetical protein